jgi:hypothetical protein
MSQNATNAQYNRSPQWKEGKRCARSIHGSRRQLIGNEGDCYWLQCKLSMLAYCQACGEAPAHATCPDVQAP